MREDNESMEAAAQLRRLAQATALSRTFREREGYDATAVEELAQWAERNRLIRSKIEPTDEDYRKVEQEHPDLAALARGSNPYLSGEN